MRTVNTNEPDRHGTNIETVANSQSMISVIIPVYNSEKRLRYCLDSIIQQTYTNLEILLIDDGSTDRSGEICEKYCHDDTRFKHIVQPNRGVAEARNNGLKAASGDYVAFIDSDDIIHNRYFEYLHRAINEGDYAMSMVLYQETADLANVDNMADVPYYTSVFPKKIMLDELYRSMRVGEIGGKPLGVVWGKLYRRQLLEGTFFDEQLLYADDIEYSVRVVWKAENAIVVPQKMYWWIFRSDSLTHSVAEYGIRYNNKLHNIMDLWFLILKHTPVNRAEYRGFCLEMLFRRILYAVYVSNKYDKKNPHKKHIQVKARTYGRLYISEFLRNGYITLTRKIGISLFYHIPMLYHVLRRLLERYSLHN